MVRPASSDEWKAPLDKLTSESTIRTCDSGQRILFLTASIDKNMDVYYQVKHGLQASTLAKKFDILYWLPCRWDGRTDGHVVTKISRMDRLPKFLRYGAPLARE